MGSGHRRDGLHRTFGLREELLPFGTVVGARTRQGRFDLAGVDDRERVEFGVDRGREADRTPNPARAPSLPSVGTRSDSILRSMVTVGDP